MTRSIDVAHDGIGYERWVGQWRHVLRTWDELVPGLRNLIAKNLSHSSIGNRRFLAAHDEYRKRQPFEIADRGRIAQIGSEASDGTLRRGAEALFLRFG